MAAATGTQSAGEGVSDNELKVIGMTTALLFGQLIASVILILGGALIGVVFQENAAERETDAVTTTTAARGGGAGGTTAPPVPTGGTGTTTTSLAGVQSSPGGTTSGGLAQSIALAVIGAGAALLPTGAASMLALRRSG